jgi:hypothetical protein
MWNLRTVNNTVQVSAIPAVNLVAGTSTLSGLDSSRMGYLLVGTVNLTTFDTGIINEFWYAVATIEYFGSIV